MTSLTVTRFDLPDSEFLTVLHQFEHTAFRLELQDSYAEPEEDALYAAWLRGEEPDARQVPELAEWYGRIAGHVAAGRRVGRVRVQQDPPTDYQRFERWLDPLNLAAGEDMCYLTAGNAREIGLLPAAGRDDWWLLDSCLLIVMRFDGSGHRIQNEIVTDPAEVIKACRWRDLAVHHAARAQLPGAAA